MRALVLVLALAFSVATGSQLGSETRLVSIGFGCVVADREWHVTTTARGIDSSAGHIEPSDRAWRINWLSGAWEDLLKPSDSTRIISKRTESIRGRDWPFGLVERAGERFWVASDGLAQFLVPAGTAEPVDLLKELVGRYRKRTEEMKCESPVESK